MQWFAGLNERLNHLVWGAPMMALILGAGVYLSMKNGFPQFVHFGFILKHTLGRVFEKGPRAKGAVSPFQAMCMALAASIGTGNVAGVAGAIALGGPGAVFWMWVSALVGMCTKYCEVTLALRFRRRNRAGEWVGGPMYYIRDGLGRRWAWLARMFALFGLLASFGIGNMAQVNTIAGAVNAAVSGFAVTTRAQQTAIAWGVSILCALLAGAILLGGTRRLAQVASLVVPGMAAVYLAASMAVIVAHGRALPAALGAILRGAFTPAAVVGGASGIGLRQVVTRGVSRGIFSNEAGMGSAAIVHAAADVKHPVQQGIYGVFEVFADTILVCTMTALVVLLGVGVEGIPYGRDAGAALTIQGFRSVFGGPVSGLLVAVTLTMFAFSTVLTWALYGTRCVEFLLGARASRAYQVIFCLVAGCGGGISLRLAWQVADTLNGLMALPNLVGVLALSPVVARLTRSYFSPPAGK